MKEIKKNIFLEIIDYIIFGIGIGTPISLICIYSFGADTKNMFQLVIWVCASALFGLMSLFLSKTEINLIVATAIHFVACFAVTAVATILCGYFSSVTDFLIFCAPVFVSIYLVIYVIFTLKARYEAKKINEALNYKR